MRLRGGGWVGEWVWRCRSPALSQCGMERNSSITLPSPPAGPPAVCSWVAALRLFVRLAQEEARLCAAVFPAPEQAAVLSQVQADNDAMRSLMWSCCVLLAAESWVVPTTSSKLPCLISRSNSNLCPTPGGLRRRSPDARGSRRCAGCAPRARKADWLPGHACRNRGGAGAAAGGAGGEWQPPGAPLDGPGPAGAGGPAVTGVCGASCRS